MTRETLHLPAGYKPMTDEEWEKNKVCADAKRDHKWRWKYDIAAGTPSLTHAVCVHCGIELELTRKEHS